MEIEKAIQFLMDKEIIRGDLNWEFKHGIEENRLFYKEKDDNYFCRFANFFILFNGGHISALNLEKMGIMSTLMAVIYGLNNITDLQNQEEVKFEKLLTSDNENIREFVKILLRNNK